MKYRYAEHLADDDLFFLDGMKYQVHDRWTGGLIFEEFEEAPVRFLVTKVLSYGVKGDPEEIDLHPHMIVKVVQK